MRESHSYPLTKWDWPWQASQKAAQSKPLGGAGRAADKSSSESEEISIPLLLNELEERDDGAHNAGRKEAQLLGRDSPREHEESALESARNPTEDPAREEAQGLKGVELRVVSNKADPGIRVVHPEEGVVDVGVTNHV
ncbi:hypothetical protein K438DRAFT_1781563 [Mycena galopus ATCC 62051]|nr:hypothetical protein K438DRAFT_1783977 [Mycena galopus ATCC 62051]KAF8145851.1 hypothetical protein K438DRAFT_1781563 [Mycena galopus ATCC 62051]